MPAVAFKVAIPARYAASRLPGKPLREIAGRPLIGHVHARAIESGADEVVIATDDTRVQAVAEGLGARVCLTRADHPSGTDRLAEVAEKLEWDDDTVVVNLQGDEPLMPPGVLEQVAFDLAGYSEAEIATLCARIHDAGELFSPDVVKVILDEAGFALYFSRAPIPWDREAFAETQEALPAHSEHLRHVGLYAYRVSYLRRHRSLGACPLERAESLEQLRALWHGVRIHVSHAAEPVPAGVDTEADLERVAKLLSSNAQIENP